MVNWGLGAAVGRQPTSPPGPLVGSGWSEPREPTLRAVVHPATAWLSRRASFEMEAFLNMRSIARLFSALVIVGAVSACSVTSGRESGSQYVDDATITTKV